MLLTDAQWNGQYDLFEDGVHYVLYKDERDLERLVLRYLEDDDARERIERAAAAHALAAHSTPARVAQLVERIEAQLHDREPSRAADNLAGWAFRQPARPAVSEDTAALPRVPPASAAARSPGRRLRLLVFAADEPATISQVSYGERLALDLAERGQEIVLVRRTRCALPNPALAGLDLIELDPGPVPQPLGRANRLLVEASALHARLHARLAELPGSALRFDAAIGEGPQGGLVLASWAARTGTPFLLALEDCEVRARGNRLNREQLYLAELEQWAADRAVAVLSPRALVVEAVAAHYRHAHATRLVASARVPSPPTPADSQRLLSALGVEDVFDLVLAPLDPGQARTIAADYADGLASCRLVAGDELWRIDSGPTTGPQRLSTRPVRGPALAALVLGARSVQDRCEDARSGEVEHLRGAPAPAPREDLSSLEQLLSRQEEVAPALL